MKFLNRSSIFILFFVILIHPLSAKSHHKKKYNLVICTLFQNESFYLKEWIEYHTLLGVEHFYLYDNLSDDDSVKILKPYIKQGLVTLTRWPRVSHNHEEHRDYVQDGACNHALDIVKKTAKWAAFIDVDEFIVPMRGRSLPKLLHLFDDHAGIVINWQVYGTSNIEHLSDGELLTEHLLYKAPEDYNGHHYVKAIVQPKYVECFRHGPHVPRFKEGYYPIKPNGQKFKGMFNDTITIDLFRINHYYTGTLEWLYQNKIPRRSKWGLHFTEEKLNHILNDYNQVYDDCILRFVPELKKRMGIDMSANHDFPLVFFC